MQKEIWKDIPDYEGLYQASNLGRIKSLKRYVITKHGYQLPVIQKILKQITSNCGYKRVELNRNGKGKLHSVHRLVAKTFLKDYNEKLQVNHKNGIKSDNNVLNLEMVTAKENQIHSYHVLKTKPSMQGHFGSNHVRAVKINQYDITGEYIRTWDSLVEASKNLDISACCISNACGNRRKSAGGYIWKYAEK